jgi:hypothetical protein
MSVLELKTELARNCKIFLCLLIHLPDLALASGATVLTLGYLHVTLGDFLLALTAFKTITMYTFAIDHHQRSPCQVLTTLTTPRLAISADEPLSTIRLQITALDGLLAALTLEAIGMVRA